MFRVRTRQIPTRDVSSVCCSVCNDVDDDVIDVDDDVIDVDVDDGDVTLKIRVTSSQAVGDPSKWCKLVALSATLPRRKSRISEVTSLNLDDPEFKSLILYTARTTVAEALSGTALASAPSSFSR